MERYTTAAWLDLEEYLVAQARREVPQLVTAGQAAATLAGTNLDEAQREVAAGLLTARTATSVLVAPAGAGKTHTVAAFARAWTAWTGRRVIGAHRSRPTPPASCAATAWRPKAWPRRTTSPSSSAAWRTADPGALCG